MHCLFRCAYTNWTTTATSCDDFFTDPNAIQLYKNHIRTVLTRVNTVTGIPYGSDPTIMGKGPPLEHASIPYRLDFVKLVKISA